MSELFQLRAQKEKDFGHLTSLVWSNALLMGTLSITDQLTQLGVEPSREIQLKTMLLCIIALVFSGIWAKLCSKVKWMV